MNVKKVIAGFLRVAAEDLQGAHAGIGHQLDRMVDSIPDENPVKRKLREIQGLEIYATSYRYPTTVGRIKPAPDIVEIENLADKVEAALQEVVKSREHSSMAPATNTHVLSAHPVRWTGRASRSAQSPPLAQ